MRDVYLSNCEKNFVNKIVSEGHVRQFSFDCKHSIITVYKFYKLIFSLQRIDGRTYDESRTLNISFGSEYGSCIVSLGETKYAKQLSL